MEGHSEVGGDALKESCNKLCRAPHPPQPRTPLWKEKSCVCEFGAHPPFCGDSEAFPVLVMLEVSAVTGPYTDTSSLVASQGLVERELSGGQEMPIQFSFFRVFTLTHLWYDIRIMSMFPVLYLKTDFPRKSLV